MPAYNVGKYIADTIKSVLSQQYAYWELLIIDDGSIDTREVVQTFKDGRIKMLTQPNAGVFGARNKDLEQMSGSFFCFISFVHREKVVDDQCFYYEFRSKRYSHCNLDSFKEVT